ncbi:MAG: TlpA family protein disulfide reductase [Pseudohongiellaceae bacterium]
MLSKQSYLCLTLAFLMLIAGQLSASEPDTKDHIGEISSAQLLANYPEFAKEYESFQPTKSQILGLQGLEGKEVLALFGTWCHDSEREIPRLLKLIEESEISLSRLTLYGVSRNKDDPAGVAKQHELLFTPTIIVLDDGKELTRIVERPKIGLAADIAAELSSN